MTKDPQMTEHDALHPLRPFLRNYVWEHGRVGTRYLDCTDGEVKFDEGKKARFAAEPYIYVPLDRDAADDPKAGGPAIQEAGLARFLRAAQLGKPGEAGSAAEVQRAVHDCVELAVFSAYQRDARQARDRYAQEPMFDDEIRAALVDDIRRTYTGMREQLALFDFTVLYGLPAPLLFSDAPFIDWRGCGRTSRAAPVVWKSAAAMGPLKDHNRYIVERARLWIVAATDDQLVAVQGRFAPAKQETAPSEDGARPSEQ
jgi:hypothetical protein